MKAIRFFGFISLLFVSCNTPKTFIDYDERVNFSEIKSFAVYPSLNSGLSELDEKRLLLSIRAGLKEEGLKEAMDPDVLINVYSEEFQEHSGNSVGIGVGGTGRNVGVGISGGIPLGGPETYLSLTFDIIQNENDELIWQAVVQSKINKNSSPEERQLLFDRMISKALESFPPKK